MSGKITENELASGLLTKIESGGSGGTSIILEGSSNFAGSTGVTISHTINHTDYQVDVIPTQDAGGYLGEVWITKTSTGFTVYNSGSAITAFDYNVIDTSQSIAVDYTYTDVPYNVYRLNIDANEIATRAEWKRTDGTLHKTSELSGGTSPQYTTRTVTFYDTDGVTIKETRTYTLTYNANGTIISETLV